MISLYLTNTGRYFLNSKHKAKLPQVQGTFLYQDGACKHRVSLCRGHLDCAHCDKCDHECDAQKTHTCANVSLKTLLFLESELDTFTEQID